MIEHTAHIHAWNLGRLQERVASYARCATKLGLTSPTITIGERYTEKCGRDRIPRVVVTIRGEAPHLAGWTLLATLDHQENGNVIRSVPGHDVDLTAYRQIDSRCDHCSTLRRRNETFVVRHEGGDIKQVGRTCLKDFLGHTAISQLLAYAELWDEIEDAGWIEAPLAGTSPDEIALDMYLPWVAMVIREYGWVSKANAIPEIGRPSTSHTATVLLDKCQRGRYKGAGPSDRDRADAESAVSYVLALTGTISEYEHNLMVIAETGTCKWNQTGYAASMISYYYRAIERDMERKRHAAKPSTHIGQVKERIEIECEVIGIYTVDGDWGTTTIYSFRMESGQVCKWFASRDQELDRGDWITLRGTVKKHDEYKGQLQTVLTRCKVLSRRERRAA